jgi:hypothetical protein
MPFVVTIPLKGIAINRQITAAGVDSRKAGLASTSAFI